MLRPVNFLQTISVNDISLHLGGLVVLFMLWMHKSRPFWLVSDQISTCWLAKSMVQHKTHQQKTHNSQHEILPPYPPAALPSPSMGRPVALPIHGTEATKVTKQGVQCLVCAQRGWFPCSGRRTETPQKSERREGSWPYGQNLIKTHNNQPEINDSGRRDVGEKACRGWSVWGDVLPLFGWWLGQRQKRQNESRQGWRRLPIDEDTHSNQPEIDGPGGGNTGEEVWPGVIAWEMQCHRFGGNSDQSNNKTKINPLLIEINFFLGRIVKLKKTLVNHPRPTPSKEAPGGEVGWFATSMPLLWRTAPPWLHGLLDGRQGSWPSKIYYSCVDKATVA